MKGTPKPHSTKRPAQHARPVGSSIEGMQVPAARLLATRRAHELLGKDLAHELVRRHPAVDERDDSQPPRLGAVSITAAAVQKDRWERNASAT